MRTWHGRSVLEAALLALEAGGHLKHRLPVLLRGDVAGGEGLAVARALHDVDERHRHVTGEQEVGVQAVHRQRVRHRAAGGHQRLAYQLRPRGFHVSPSGGGSARRRRATRLPAEHARRVGALAQVMAAEHVVLAPGVI